MCLHAPTDDDIVVTYGDQTLYGEFGDATVADIRVASTTGGQASALEITICDLKSPRRSAAEPE